MTNIIYLLENGDTLNVCGSYNVLSILLLIKKIVSLLSIVVPITLIILLSIDGIKALLSGNMDEELKKLGSKISKRIILAFIFFFIPTIINLMAQFIGFINYDASMCWKNATETTIKQLKSEKDKEKEEKEEEANKQSQEEESKKEENSNNAQNNLQNSINKKEEEEKNNLQNSFDSIDNTNVKTNGKYIFLGDSRTVGIELIGKNDPGVYFVCKGGMGYHWFINTAIDEVNKLLNEDGYTIFFNLGINGTVKTSSIDMTQAAGYVSKIKELANGAWSKHKIVIVSLFPVDDAHNKYQLNDAGAVIFNKYMKEQLGNYSNNISYCDAYNGITDKSAFNTGDGLHFAPAGYKIIYNYVKENCK